MLKKANNVLRTRAVALAWNILLALGLLLNATPAKAGVYEVKDCSYYGNTAPAFTGSSSVEQLNTPDECMVWSGTAYRSLEINESGGSVPHGFSAQWSTVTPSPAIKITAAYTPLNQVSVDCALGSDGFTAQFYWGDNGQLYGTQSINPAPTGPAGSLCYGLGINRPVQPSRYFGWTTGCYLKSSCNAQDHGDVLGVRGIYLKAEEDTGPTIIPLGLGNLWYERGWVRGIWPMPFNATDPSGVCSTHATVNGKTTTGPGDPAPDQAKWQQCPDQRMDQQVDTTSFADGVLPLSLSASNAAGVSTTSSARVYVDNRPITLALSGPADAPVTAGTQYITATAAAGPSGVRSIACSLDHAPGQSYARSSVRIPVVGLGTHHLSCVAHNGALNASGQPGSSAIQTWTMTIREPSVTTLWFARSADKLRCAKRRERLHIPAHWIVEHVHGQAVRVRVPAQTRTIKVVKCRTRGLKPGVSTTTKRVRFGASTQVSGWLGTANGTALGGQRVEVMTAPANGSGAFSAAALTTTAANGTWSSRLPAGPSRFIRAVYVGSSTVEPASSGLARLIVPGSITLAISPHRTHWGGTIAIRGDLRGGYVPTSGELVVLWIGWRGGSTEIGHLYARRNGRFHSIYTFLRGNGTETYWLWAATARESDYPYAPSQSQKVRVTVRQ